MLTRCECFLRLLAMVLRGGSACDRRRGLAQMPGESHPE